jgi:predicted DCC family thiol-disulfide oxidoreductase YuxK
MALQTDQKVDCKKTIYYDGSCNMCNAIIKKVDNSSQKEKFNPKDITKDTLPQNISKSAAEKEIHVVDENGKIYKNAEAILKILEEYPKWKLIVAIGRLPIIKQILPIGYKFIASHRHSVFNSAKKKGPNTFNLFIIGFIFLYFMVGTITGFLGVKEIFPFFSWSLFSRVPNKTTSEYAVIVSTYNGMTVFPPRLFQEAKEIIHESESIIARRLIQDFGKAYQNMEIREADELRKLFEANFIKSPAKYRLIRMIHNPVERWKTGRYEIINMQEFTIKSGSL